MVVTSPDTGTVRDGVSPDWKCDDCIVVNVVTVHVIIVVMVRDKVVALLQCKWFRISKTSTIREIDQKG